MIRSPILILSVLGAVFLPTAAPAAGDPGRELQEATLCDLAVAPIDAGQHRKFLEANLGGPVEETAYPLDPEAAPGSETIAYFVQGQGWNAWICGTEGVFVLERFVLERNHPGMPLPVSLGQTAEEAEKILGPGVSRGEALTYDAPRWPAPASFHRVILRLAQGRVAAIEWIMEPKRPRCPHLDKVNGRLRTRQASEAPAQPLP